MQQHIVEQLDDVLVCCDPPHAIELGGGFVAEQKRGQSSDGQVYGVTSLRLVCNNGAFSLMEPYRVYLVVPR